MNQYLIDKLKEGRLNKGLKQSDVTKLTGIKNTTLSNYENGNTEPDMDTFLQLCRLYDLDYAEIIREAYGYKIPGEQLTIKASDIDRIRKYHNLDDHGRKIVDTVLAHESDRVKALAEQARKILELQRAIIPRYIMAYYEKMASAGSGEYLFDDIPTDLIEVPDCPMAHKADFVIGVTGHSMEPTYCDGDKVYVKKMAEIPTGSIGIFVRGNECFIKELGVDRLISHNKKYPDIPASEDIRLVGKVLGKVEGNLSGSASELRIEMASR